jgi:hypothetical protein
MQWEAERAGNIIALALFDVPRALRQQPAYRCDGDRQCGCGGVRQYFAQRQRTDADGDQASIRRPAVKLARQSQERCRGCGVDQTGGWRRCGNDLAHGDSAGVEIDGGVYEDHEIRRGDAFGQFRRELMANDRTGVVVRAPVRVPVPAPVRKCTGGGLADCIIASQRIAIADDELVSRQGRPPKSMPGVRASPAAFP